MAAEGTVGGDHREFDAFADRVRRQHRIHVLERQVFPVAGAVEEVRVGLAGVGDLLEQHAVVGDAPDRDVEVRLLLRRMTGIVHHRRIGETDVRQAVGGIDVGRGDLHGLLERRHQRAGVLVVDLGGVLADAREHDLGRVLARRIQRRILEETRLTCSIGIAPNRYLAKLATDMQKPNGLTFLNSTDLPEKLYTLQLRDLPGVGHNMEQRLLNIGIRDVRTLCHLDASQLRKAWGSVWGERMYYYLRGIELPEIETERSSVGHSHVLAPDMRPTAAARHVARRLTIKCASRLRRMGYTAGAISLSVRVENGPRYGAEALCIQACDSFTFLHLLDGLWNDIMHHARPARLKKVSVTLSRLREADTMQHDLFESQSNDEKQRREKAERMSRALDALNHRFGRDTVSIGMMPEQGRSFSGTKIAFTRIPDTEEFLE